MQLIFTTKSKFVSAIGNNFVKKIIFTITLLYQSVIGLIPTKFSFFYKKIYRAIKFGIRILACHKNHSAALLFIISILFSSSAIAVESLESRKKVATSRNRKFYRTDRAKQVIGINGYYGSDYNSKNYEIGGRYLFQSNKFINELNLQYSLGFADTGSGKNKRYMIKNKDEYDGIFSSKIKLNDTEYYSVFFHRTIYDRLSAEYYDIRNALGLGRMFFDDKLELDLSGGQQKVKRYGDEFEVVGSLRLNHKIGEKINITQRGFVFVSHGAIDKKIMTSLIYRFENKVSFEIRHDFSTRNYDAGNNVVINRVSRSINFGLVFDLS